MQACTRRSTTFKAAAWAGEADVTQAAWSAEDEDEEDKEEVEEEQEEEEEEEEDE